MEHIREDYVKAAQNSFSVAQMCRELGIKPIGGNYQTIKNKIREYNIDISHFTGRAWNQGKRYRLINPPKPLEEILKENTSYQSVKLKKRLLESGLKELKCECCNNTEWLGEPINLELHHINGNHSDNRLENLQLLCPNCHSYTDTYRGKNRNKYENKKDNVILLNDSKKELIKKEEKPKRYCVVCGKQLNRKQAKYCSDECCIKSITKRPNKDEFVKILNENDYNLTKVGYIYNVSPNAIKKWCKKYNIEKDSFYHSKKVNQYDLDGNFIASYNSITEAIKLSKVSNVKKVLQKERPSAGGYIWKYENED
jgi:predicted nucleic acid-binding Zn ribbon protein